MLITRESESDSQVCWIRCASIHEYNKRESGDSRFSSALCYPAYGIELKMIADPTSPIPAATRYQVR